jgi:hypothetical protein
MRVPMVIPAKLGVFRATETEGEIIMLCGTCELATTFCAAAAAAGMIFDTSGISYLTSSLRLRQMRQLTCFSMPERLQPA